MNSEMKIIREVNIQAEDFYDDAVALGDLAAVMLKEKHRSQMTSLENIAESTLKTSDVFDYIKKQTARFPYWRQSAPGQNNSGGFGERLRTYLENDLKKRLENICGPQRLNIGNAAGEDMQERRRIYLLLIRQFIRQLVVEYEYQVSLGQNNYKKRGE
jgi:hypothetical protein